MVYVGLQTFKLSRGLENSFLIHDLFAKVARNLLVIDKNLKVKQTLMNIFC